MNVIETHIEQFISEVCAGKTNETPVAYRSKLFRFGRWLDERGLDFCRLTSKRVDEFRLCLQSKGLSPFTIHTTLMTVRHFLKWSHLAGLTADIASTMIIPPTPKPEPKAIEADAVLRLLDAASRTGEPWERARNLAMIYVLRDTAGRIGAIIKADIDQLDLKRGKLLVREKGNKPHYLYLNSPTIAALRIWLKVRPELEPKDRKLFISCRGRGLARSSVYSLLERIKLNTTVIQGRTNPHAFRHAWARDALSAGEDISRVAATLGNSVRVTAEYYALWSDAEVQKAHGQYSPGLHLPIIKPKKD